MGHTLHGFREAFAANWSQFLREETGGFSSLGTKAAKKSSEICVFFLLQLLLRGGNGGIFNMRVAIGD